MRAVGEDRIFAPNRSGGGNEYITMGVRKIRGGESDGHRAVRLIADYPGRPSRHSPKDVRRKFLRANSVIGTLAPAPRSRRLGSSD